ncbi:MAG: DsbA family protein [Nitrospira sp.]|nr:DsbA family protein [Nitrospira sp.]
MTTRAEAKLTVPVGERDHIQGPTEAPVTLVEYGDYECSYCGQAYFVVKELQRLLGNRLRFVFRNFPLTTVHPYAQRAAEAAEAAGAQGKFWEMHDHLFEHQQELDDKHQKKYAAQLGLDLSRFNRDMSEHRYAARIREDLLSGVRCGVNGTPTFCINGVRYDGAPDLDSMVAAIEESVASV